ncbi:MAG: tyrosine recombinase XerC [Clostridia bacterium]|nr:tyrosine recombinase XerC [Clostridia bacterium]
MNIAENNTFELLEDYIGYITVVKSYSPKTVYEYRLDLTLFFRFLKIRYGLVPADTELDKIDISDVDADFIKRIRIEDIQHFAKYLATEREHVIHSKTLKGNSSRALSRRLSCIKSFFKYLTAKRHIIDENPSADLDLPKHKKSLPVHLTVNDSVKLLESIDGTFKERDYAIITLFLNCGMRLSELVAIDISDIKDDTIVITGKGNKQRTAYLNEACLNALNDYYPKRQALAASAKKPHDRALFLSRLSRRISPKTVQWIVKNYIEKAGLDTSKYSVHKLRHTAATLMYQYGNVDLRTLQTLLGHEQLSTTEIYTHVREESLKSAVEKNPLAGVKKKQTNVK